MGNRVFGGALFAGVVGMCIVLTAAVSTDASVSTMAYKRLIFGSHDCDLYCGRSRGTDTHGKNKRFSQHGGGKA